MAFFNISNRYYLNGIDWVMAALDKLNKKHTGVGNHSQLILVLNGYLDKTKLSEKLCSILSKNDFLKGRVKRAWNLAPYWAPLKQSFNPEDIGVFNLKLNPHNKKDLDKILQNCAMKPFKDDETLLGFDLIYHDGLTYLVMKFNHRMYDARGAEALLEHILTENNLDIQFPLPVQGAKLNQWKSRFLSGQVINRFLRSIYSKDTIVAKTSFSSTAESYASHGFICTAFTKDHTSTIDAMAVQNAGYLMNGIYLLSCVAKSFSSLYKKKSIKGHLLVPINVDVRKTKFNAEKIFFNNVSFMLFKIKQDLSLPEFIKKLKTQFIDQVKNKIPFQFINASLLMRIMPLNALSFFMNLRMKKTPCSFSFSYIAEQAFNLSFVQNLEVVNLFHMPLVPVNPGVGVFFTRFNHKINMVISSSDSNLNKQDGTYLQGKIIATLIKGSNDGKI